MTVVTRVKEDCCVQDAAFLSRGDRIVSGQSVDIRRLPLKDAIQALTQSTNGCVEIEVCKPLAFKDQSGTKKTFKYEEIMLLLFSILLMRLGVYEIILFLIHVGKSGVL